MLAQRCLCSAWVILCPLPPVARLRSLCAAVLGSTDNGKIDGWDGRPLSLSIAAGQIWIGTQICFCPQTPASRSVARAMVVCLRTPPLDLCLLCCVPLVSMAAACLLLASGALLCNFTSGCRSRSACAQYHVITGKPHALENDIGWATAVVLV